MSNQLVSVIIWLSWLLQHYIEIIVHPQSVNTTLNSTVSFTCEAIAELIVFKANDMSLSIGNIARGFKQKEQTRLNGMKKKRVLSVTAFQDNNNTNISCRAYGDPVNINSDIAVLRIQGELML